MKRWIVFIPFLFLPHPHSHFHFHSLFHGIIFHQHTLYCRCIPTPCFSPSTEIKSERQKRETSHSPQGVHLQQRRPASFSLSSVGNTRYNSEINPNSLWLCAASLDSIIPSKATNPPPASPLWSIKLPFLPRTIFQRAGVPICEKDSPWWKSITSSFPTSSFPPSIRCSTCYHIHPSA